MAGILARARLLLPDPGRFGGQRLGEAVARAFGRADLIQFDGSQHTRIFDVLPRGWPAAAATRQMDAGDGAGATWLRADPAHVQPDINGARLLAHGSGLHLTAQDVAAFMPALRPLFGDFGCPIDAPTPSRWYLRLPMQARLPAFSSPEEALGDELFDHLPGSHLSESGGDDREGRRWRTLLSEAQIVLHNHPRNGERAAAGLATVNSLWFWGGGVLPDHVHCIADVVCSDDDSLAAFARLAGTEAQPLPARCPDGPAGRDIVIDLRDSRDLAVLQRDWLEPLLEQLAAGGLDELVLDAVDGRGFVFRRRQRLRFWRRPRPRLAE